ncbi:unnamed protein product, partial [Rotaria sp. Silwood1]
MRIRKTSRNFRRLQKTYKTSWDFTAEVSAVPSLARTNALNSKSTTPKGLLSSYFDIPKNDLKLTSASYDELKEYMALDVQLTEHDDILKFRLQQKSKFPILFSMVQDFYAVPASNT